MEQEILDEEPIEEDYDYEEELGEEEDYDYEEELEEEEDYDYEEELEEEEDYDYGEELEEEEDYDYEEELEEEEDYDAEAAEEEEMLTNRIKSVYNMVYYAEEMDIDTRDTNELIADAREEVDVGDLDKADKLITRALDQIVPILKEKLDIDPSDF
ncbi:MAG: hypothetical protein R6U17_08690 [Thermoplasmata archaeon]